MTYTECSKTTHYSKESIEIACLEEARERFTEANATSFLTEPLLLELGIIGTQLEQFDQMASGSYQLPPDAPKNAKQLIPLLVRPATKKD